MSFISGINFRHGPSGSSQNRQPASPHQRPPPDDDGGDDSPERHSRTASPNAGAGMSERSSPQQLKEYAITRARQNWLSATAEEGLVEFSQLGHEEKLIDLYSKLARIEQQMGRSENNAVELQSNLELPSVPKKVMSDISYKAALILMATAEQMNYQDGANKPATLIMDSLRGRQEGFDKAWLTGAREVILRSTVGKTCNGLRYDVKRKIADSIKNKNDILTLTVDVVSHLSKHCNDITAHEALAIHMAFLRAVYVEDPGLKFWTTVDKDLEGIRKECAEPDAISFTEALSQIYNKDITAYPPENRSLLSQAHPTTAQSDMNRHVQSRS